MDNDTKSLIAGLGIGFVLAPFLRLVTKRWKCAKCRHSCAHCSKDKTKEIAEGFQWAFPELHTNPRVGAVLNVHNSKLFTPFTSRGMTIKNRVVVYPMCMYSSDDGFFNDWHLRNLGTFAVGGAGLIFTEATAVSPNGRISPTDAGLWKDEHIAAMKRVVDYVHAQDAKIGIQLAHAGRKASTLAPFLLTGHDTAVEKDLNGWREDSHRFVTEDTGVVGPSSIRWSENYALPIALSKQGIRKVIQQFVDAAKRAEKAGFDLIEIHGAHGYLAHEFLSPISNQRTDEYGGSLENRMRFILELTEALRVVWPQKKPIWARISATDWIAEEKTEKGVLPAGWDIESSLVLSARLKQLGVDLVDVSTSGTSLRQNKLMMPALGPCFQAGFANQIRSVVGVATGAVGMITTPQEAEQIVAQGKADVVLLARALLREPYWPLRAATELGVDIAWQPQNSRSKTTLEHHKKRLEREPAFAQMIRDAERSAKEVVAKL